MLPIEAETRIRFNIAQLYASLQQWREVDRRAESLVPLRRGSGSARVLPAGDRLLPARRLRPGHRQHGEGGRPLARSRAEGWLQLLAALYIQKEDYAERSAAPRRAGDALPEEAVLGAALADLRRPRRLPTRRSPCSRSRTSQGLLTEDKELRRLARSYLYHDLPYPAAKVLEKGLEDGAIDADAEAYELLANSWIAAREYDRSLAPLQKAAELSDDGNLFVRLGQVHLQREEWSEAAEQLQQAIEKGGLEDPGNAELLLGIAYYNDRARRAGALLVRAGPPARVDPRKARCAGSPTSRTKAGTG